MSFTAIQICYPRQVSLANSVNQTNDDDSEYISGYPVICVDNEFVPLCNNTKLSQREISYICASSSNFTCELVFIYWKYYDNSCSMYVCLLHLCMYTWLSFIHMCTSVVFVYLNYYKEYISKGVQHFSILTKTKPKCNIPSLNQTVIMFPM